MVQRILVAGLLVAVTSPAWTQYDPAIDNYVEPLVWSNNFAGVILVSVDDEIVFHQAYGHAVAEEGIEHSNESVFQIASVSKPFTACAIMQLVEQERISLNDPVSRFIPDFTRGDEITIHHLLTHTSGIQNINGMPGYHLWEQQDNDLPGLINRFKDQPLRFDPGERYDYSNSNYNVLALIIEQVSGEAFGAYLKKHMFGPLSMSHTGHPDGNQSPTQVVPGYRPEDIADKAPARKINWSVKTGNGSLYASADDLYRWSRAFMRDQIVTGESRELMLTPHVDHVGYGWFVRPRNGRNQFHINGRSPGFTAVLSIYPDEKITVVILSNNYVPVPTEMSIDIASIVLGEPYKPLLSGDGKTDAHIASQVMGQYQFGPDFYQPDKILTVRYEDAYLVMEWGALLWKGGTEFINRNYWMDVRFEETEFGWTMHYGDFKGQRL